MIRMMRDDQVFENGQPIPKIAPEFFIGAVANPFSPPFDFRPLRLAKKIAAGAQFIQTQLVYNLDRFRDYMRQVVDLGLHERVAIMAGIGPVKSLAGLEFMRNEVAGMDVPEALLARMQGLSKDDQTKVGVDIACEIGAAVRQIEGVSGLHLMAIGASTLIPEVVERLGLFPRPLL